jgi:hypothetical protein
VHVRGTYWYGAGELGNVYKYWFDLSSSIHFLPIMEYPYVKNEISSDS